MNELEALMKWDELSEAERQELTILKSLSLSENNLTSWPKFISKLKELKNLDLSYNQLTRLPEWIGNLTKLEYLSLGDNNLTSLPKLPASLQYLDLSFNQLTSLPKSIGQLKKLEQLKLRSNQLTRLPESIGQLTNLKELFLMGNQLTSLPETIGKLTNLKELILVYNQLTSLPESILNLRDTIIVTDTQGFTVIDKEIIEDSIYVPVYLLVNKYCVLKKIKQIVDLMEYKVKPVSEALNQENIEAYLDACIEKEWRINEETTIMLYELITGNKDFNNFQKDNTQVKKLISISTPNIQTTYAPNNKTNYKIPHKELTILL